MCTSLREYVFQTRGDSLNERLTEPQTKADVFQKIVTIVDLNVLLLSQKYSKCFQFKMYLQYFKLLYKNSKFKNLNFF